MPRIPGSHSRGGLAATDISATFAHAAEQDIESATINAAAHIFLSSITLIGEFLAKTKRYRERLSGAGSGTVMSDSWQRMDWVLFKKDGLKSLRDALQLRLANINVLLATAQFHGIMPDHVAQFQEKSVESSSHCLPPKYVAHVPESEAVDENPLVIEIDPTSDILVEDSTAEAPVTAGIDIEPVSKHLILSHMANSTCQSAVEESNVALRAECVTFSNNYPAERDEASLPTVLPETTFQEGCETSSVKDSPLPQGAITDGVKLQSQLEVFLSHTGNLGRERQEPVRFKDAVGRKFTFPYNLCATWAGMEELTKQSFLHVDIIGPHVHQGHYDLIGPTSEIILPQVWETMIQPGHAITMHMWAMPEPPRPENGVPLPPPQPGFGSTQNGTRQNNNSRGHPVSVMHPKIVTFSRFEEKSKVRGWMEKAEGLFERKTVNQDGCDSSSSGSSADG